jgi:hypothetical protein
MKKIRFLPLLLLLTLFQWGCKDKLPEPSQSGANVVACKVNGKVWIADEGDSFRGKKFTVYYYNDLYNKRRFVLYANRIAKDNNSNIVLAVTDVRTTGTHYFSFDTNPYPDNRLFLNHGSYFLNKPDQARYTTSSRYTGSITFTRVDTVRHIFAGTFEFTAANIDGSGQTVKVTDGRFDVNY